MGHVIPSPWFQRLCIAYIVLNAVLTDVISRRRAWTASQPLLLGMGTGAVRGQWGGSAAKGAAGGGGDVPARKAHTQSVYGGNVRPY